MSAALVRRAVEISSSVEDQASPGQGSIVAAGERIQRFVFALRPGAGRQRVIVMAMIRAALAAAKNFLCFMMISPYVQDRMQS